MTRAHFTPKHWLLCHVGLYLSEFEFDNALVHGWRPTRVVCDHTRVLHAHARPLHPAAWVFVAYGIVLVRVRVRRVLGLEGNLYYCNGPSWLQMDSAEVIRSLYDTGCVRIKLVLVSLWLKARNSLQLLNT